MQGVGRHGPLGPLRLGSGGRDPRVAAHPGDGWASLREGRSEIASTPGDLVPSDRRPTIPPDAPASTAQDEREAWIVLTSVDGIGPASFGALLRRAGSARAVLDRAAAGPDALRDLPPDPDPTASRPKLPDDVLDRLVAAARAPGALLEEVAELGLVTVTLEDEGYPVRLRATELAPPVLYVLGEPAALSGRPPVAVVGTRRPTELGRRVAARIAGAITRAGGVVVSGLAIGIDGVAHEAALVEGGPTVAVLGAGHRHVTPVAHRGLARRIAAEGGAIVSESPPGALPTRWSFPRRNRIISGLAGATVVVEAAIRSGALITAAWALEQGRECFLVPGSLDDASARGCLRFLRDHAGLARVVAGIPELLEDLGLEAAPAERLRGGPPAGSVAARIAELVAGGLATVDELAAAMGIPAAAVLGALTVLELQGLVRPVVGRYRPAGMLATRASTSRLGDRGT
jgi:DNA processing protein